MGKSHYYATVNAETCDGCETCADRCQVDAIQFADDMAIISTANCIGCGLCASACPTESISMSHKAPDALSHIFANDDELTQARAKDTDRVFPFE